MWANFAGGAACAAAPAGTTSVWLGNAGGWLARVDLANAPRPASRDAVRRMQCSGKTVIPLSGDEARAVQAVAAQLGIATAAGGRLPDAKLAYVRRLQANGGVVALAGTNATDAALPGTADVGFALGTGVMPPADALDSTRRLLALMRQNLAWSVFYDVAALAAVAGGALEPWQAGYGAAAASALVVRCPAACRGWRARSR